MLTANHHDFCSEFYIVEKVIQVVATIGSEDRSIKIEALFDPVSGDYSTAAYLKEDFTLQPTYPQNGDGFTRERESVQLWVGYTDFPWTSGKSADDVLASALSFLRERTRKAVPA